MTQRAIVLMSAPMKCNRTGIQSTFIVTKKKEVDIEVSMLRLYSVLNTEIINCFSLIRRRETDLSALLRPFNLSVWILI